MATIDIIDSIASIVLATAVIVSVNHLYRVSGQDRPHDPERQRRFIANASYHLFDKEVFAKATEVMGLDAAAKAWMNEPCIGLDNEKPVDLVRTFAGAAAAKTYLNQIAHGVYASPPRRRSYSPPVA